MSKKNKNKNKSSSTTSLYIYNEKIAPKDLKVNPFFIDVLSMDADKMFEFNLKALEALGYDDIKSYWHPTDGYIFARGTLPVCLCAHMDKVPQYKSIKSIDKYFLADKNKMFVDVFLSSEQGIGGDDRCGVYAILQMLKLGHRPSVLFCMGEEIGCKGSHKFAEDFPKEFLSDVNAFIQIDRRGNRDCVRYTDDSEELTKAICDFDFKHAIGSFTDICVLMPHFGISGVNLSSGYYNEHTGKTEHVSISDVNYLLKRLNKILSSDIFTKKDVYVPHKYVYSYTPMSTLRGAVSSTPSPYKQMSLFPEYEDFVNEPDDGCEDEPIYYCDVCGKEISSYEAKKKSKK